MSHGFRSHYSRANPSPYSPHEQRTIDKANAKNFDDYLQGYYEPPQPLEVQTNAQSKLQRVARRGGYPLSENTIRELGNYMLDSKRLSLQSAQQRAQLAQQAASDKVQLSRMYTNSLQNGGQINQLYGPAIARRLFGF